MIELSELQLSLLLAGALLIVSIWLVNRIQLRRIQCQQNKTLSEKKITQRCEPTLHVTKVSNEETPPISRAILENNIASAHDMLTEESNIASPDQPPEYIQQDLRKIVMARRTDEDSTICEASCQGTSTAEQIRRPACTAPFPWRGRSSGPVRQGGLSRGFEQHTASLRNGLRMQAQTHPERATQPGRFCVSPKADFDPVSGTTHEDLKLAIKPDGLPGITPESQPSEILVDHIATTTTHPSTPDNEELNVLTHLESSLLDSVTPIIDPIIDCVIDLPLDYPLSSERILPLLKHLRHAGNKPIYCEGFNLKRQARELVRAGQGYRDLSIAVQLANRHGPISAIELSEFISGVQKLAKSLEITITPPDLAKVLTQAQTLDTYAQQNDVQICLHIETSQQPWLASQLKAQFEQDGLLLSHHGMHYHYYHDKNAHTPIFVLSFGQINFLYDDQMHLQDKKITLYFHAPHVAHGIHAFRLTWSYAQHLATILGGKIVDDVGTPLSDKAIKTIEQHLCELYARLNRYGIPVGSTNALRLFSPA